MHPGCRSPCGAARSKAVTLQVRVWIHRWHFFRNVFNVFDAFLVAAPSEAHIQLPRGCEVYSIAVEKQAARCQCSYFKALSLVDMLIIKPMMGSGRLDPQRSCQQSGKGRHADARSRQPGSFANPAHPQADSVTPRHAHRSYLALRQIRKDLRHGCRSARHNAPLLWPACPGGSSQCLPSLSATGKHRGWCIVQSPSQHAT